MIYDLYQYFSFILVFLYLLLGSYTDFKRREVSDWLNYSFFVFAIIYNLSLSFYYSTFDFIFSSFFGFICSFSISFLMYYFGKWGGGDAKVLINLGIFFGIPISVIFNFSSVPFFLNLVFNIFIIGSFYGVFWFFYLFFKSLITSSKRYSNFKLIIYLFVFLILFLFLFLVSIWLSLYYMLLINIFLIFILFFILVFILGRYVELNLVTKKVSVNSLVDGDWIVQRIRINNIKYSYMEFLNIKDSVFFRDLSLWFKLKVFFKFKAKYSTYSEFILLCESKSKSELISVAESDFCKFGLNSNILYLKPDELLLKLNEIKTSDISLYNSIKLYFNDSGYYIKYFNLCDSRNGSVNESIISFLNTNFSSRYVKVKEGVPFVPGIFLAFIITILFNKSLLFLFEMITFIR